MANAGEKRKRGANFSIEDELLLLEEVKKHKNVLENKTTNGVTNSEKTDAWKKILNAFNARTGQIRSIDQLRGKYDNLKTKARHWTSSNNLDHNGTGGGPRKSMGQNNPVIESVLQIMNKKSFAGMPSVGDSDQCRENGSVTMTHTSPSSRESEPSMEVGAFDDFRRQLWEAPIIVESSEKSVDIDDDIPRYVIPINNEPATCASTSTPQTLTKKVGQAVQKEIQNGSKETDWSKYSTKMLRQPKNRKLGLKPTIPNPTFHAKEDYYKKKTEYIELEIQCLNAKRAQEEEKYFHEKLYNERKQKMEEEEHKKKIILLDLQIKQMQKNLAEDNI